MANTALEAEYERAKRAQYETLTTHYREIGPASLLAALICAHRLNESKEKQARAA
ncbi:transcriptional regulator [Aquamicrobium sp. LC103]|uniref:transcriptional regulator n=1 Tax=Aquamicrobium sp. LC103 TaxID=1120658 RepID=UPI000A566390|nr:transcriptional regulator [Aquamicrobium sp. LC103]TKT81321.1 transcriptional regulator [Aquamicrobium sp. LC103]